VCGRAVDARATVCPREVKATRSVGGRDASRRFVSRPVAGASADRAARRDATPARKKNDARDES